MKSTGKTGAGGDQTKQIEELKAKLAAAEAKTRDYGGHSICSYEVCSVELCSFDRHFEEAGRPASARVRQTRD